MDHSADTAVAIVGIGAIMPDALSATAFWDNIINKQYSITEVPPDRWSIKHYYDPDPNAPDKTYSKIGGWVRGFSFDWRRFRMPPKVADAMDEGQQWAVTIAADALADYGYPERPLDTERTAVVLGTAMGGERVFFTRARIVLPEYAEALESVAAFNRLPGSTQQEILHRWQETITNKIPAITEDTMPGELPNIISGRVANVLNLRGPNFITDAACASSFAAVEAAFAMLIERKVDAVLTGGVDRNMDISSYVKFCKIGALSPTGTRPFGDGADGFVMGEGAAAFLLKRLADAERDGDRIYAVIRGVGGASDGKGKGITAPNPIGQQLAMARAWENAGLDPATATLIEAHGTSTRVGDVVEVESLQTVFGGAPPHSIALGSAKSNIGHLKAGAGAAGLLKAALAIYHKTLPPTLNAHVPNPNIDFENSPFFLNHETQEWPRRNGTPRRCGVSAYGFGGTNFHLVLEEHVPGMLSQPRTATQTVVAAAQPTAAVISAAPPVSRRPLRGILALGADTLPALQERLVEVTQRVEGGWTPPIALPKAEAIRARERLVVDFGDHDELLSRLHKAQKVMSFDNPQAWKALESQGVFRGSGASKGKIAFLFPGQGSQYVNMGRDLVRATPIVAEVFREADRVMTPILGKPLTDYVFVDGNDANALMKAEFDLMQTEITQPTVLTLDAALLRLLQSYGFYPDMVMGHSLGEYAALMAAGIMPFEDNLEAAAARGSEMSKVSVDDNGKMAFVLAPLDVVQATLAEIDGYVVPANINSNSQCVFGGASDAVDAAVDLFTERGYKASTIPVSHAFHTKIVAPASAPLRQVLDRLNVNLPTLPIVTNVTGEFYPTDNLDTIKDILQRQIASPVQWVKGVQTLYAAGARAFVEVGPKRALRGFVNDILADKTDVTALITNHPKTGELPAFNQALCGLYAAGYGTESLEMPATTTTVTAPTPVTTATLTSETPAMKKDSPAPASNGAPPATLDVLGQMLAQALQQVNAPQAATPAVYDRNAPPAGSVVISGTGLGLPGAEKSVMHPENAARILRGEQFVDLIPERFRKLMVAKRIVRVVKSEDGGGSFATIDETNDVIKLAGRPGYFDLEAEYGVPAKLIEALDITSQLAMAAGLDALREAGIPLVMTYKRTTTGKFLPDRWMLPEPLRDDTGVIFASAFPGGDRFADELMRYHTYQNRLTQLEMLEDLRRYTDDPQTAREINRRIHQLRDQLAQEPYTFDRRFLFRILSMGHSQFAQYIGARGPNTQVNAACASTAQGVSIAEDWIRAGRCRRVIVIGADDVTSDNMMEWVGAGFLAVGAATTEDRLEEAALPFDKRRHGTIMGMGACGLVVESEDAVRERGMRGVVELLSSEINNSAFHGTRLDVDHISLVMNNLITAAERRFGLNRFAMAPQMVFMSHETYTPARGGSASAEVVALRQTFGEAAKEIIVANTKGFTGHPMGVGIEDVIAVKILEHGIVPPVPNFKEVDPELGPLNLSRGGRYPVKYALHLAAGFGSQIAMTLTRRIPGSLHRIDNQPLYNRWLTDISGYDWAQTEVEKRVLRIKDQGAPTRPAAPNRWQYGTGPTMLALVTDGFVPVERPARMREAIVESGRPEAETPTAITIVAPPPAPEPAVATPPPPPPEMKPAPTPVTLARTESVAPPPVTMAAPVAPAPTPPSPDGRDPVAAQVIAIVAEQTGYPADMLDLDLDLEADLGIDTVKQAETFAAIRATFDIPRRDDLQLRDYPTLEKVIGFVRAMRPDLARDAGQRARDELVVAPSAAPVAAPAAPPADEGDPIAAKVLAIVAEQTGYPPDMLDLDLDLEADLGVDTVKQAETFAAIRATFDIPRRDDLQLRDYPTLEKVIGFVRAMRPDLVREKAAFAPSAAPLTAPSAFPHDAGEDEITAKV
ncbi:MAG: acyltransferase domain-containing protein, partial [Anaerolineales bacterium]|nr:acyltransferase domain-containing protein [Anaerolineales bacterium]